jgi:hypothetical protein
VDNFQFLEDLRVRWRQELESALGRPVGSIQAVEFTRAWRTKSEPVLLECEDGFDYVVKGQQAGRQIVNDQLVARLGELLQAPVGKPAIISIPRELIDNEPNLSDFRAGTAHGTRWIENCSDVRCFSASDLIATDAPDNRSRLVLLAVLYSWTHANDHQFLYKKNPPRLIYSVDHGHFFPNSPNWRVEDLENDTFEGFDAIFDHCNFNESELAEARERLEAIAESQILQIVAAPPPDWDFTIEERVAMMAYLVKRQQELIEFLSHR